jgi:hypothetical protein
MKADSRFRASRVCLEKSVFLQRAQFTLCTYAQRRCRLCGYEKRSAARGLVRCAFMTSVPHAARPRDRPRAVHVNGGTSFPRMAPYRHWVGLRPGAGKLFTALYTGVNNRFSPRRDQRQSLIWQAFPRVFVSDERCAPCTGCPPPPIRRLGGGEPRQLARPPAEGGATFSAAFGWATLKSPANRHEIVRVLTRWRE